MGTVQEERGRGVCADWGEGGVQGVKEWEEVTMTP